MEILALIFAGISAITAIISLIIAFIAKADVKKLQIQLNNTNKRSIDNKGKVDVCNAGENSGTIIGINSGDGNV